MLTSPFIMLPVPRPRPRAGCLRKMDATDPSSSFLIVLGADEALLLLKKEPRKSFMLGLGCVKIVIRGGHSDRIVPYVVLSTAQCALFSGKPCKLREVLA